MKKGNYGLLDGTGPDGGREISRRDGTIQYNYHFFHDWTGHSKSQFKTGRDGLLFFSTERTVHTRYNFSRRNRTVLFFFFTTGRGRIVFVFFLMGRAGSFFSLTENVVYLCPPGHAAFHVTEAGHASLCGIIGCFRGEKPSLRVVGPPGQLQPDLRRRLAQSRPSAMPGRNRGRRKPGFSSLFASQKPHEHHVQPDHDFVETLIAVSQSPIPARGSGVALPQYPRDSKDDIAS